MRIGDLTERAEVTPRTVRYHESIGLIPPASAKATEDRISSSALFRRQRWYFRRANESGLSTLVRLGRLAAVTKKRTALGDHHYRCPRDILYKRSSSAPARQRFALHSTRCGLT
jgi:hypothetical protein